MTETPASDTVNLTIDGREVAAPKGMLLIEAAKLIGIDIPVFCYEPRLKPVGACRMCLVQIEKLPRLQTACTTPVAADMVVHTTTPDDAAAIADIDEILNYVLFSLLGVLVVRDTGMMLSGVVAGVFASLLDAIVVTAASLMVPPPPTLEALEFGFARNLVIGTVFAGLSGIVYALVQRWSGGRRSRR